MRSNVTPSVLAITTLATLLAGCSSSSQPASPAVQTPAQPAPTPQVVTAKTAFWPMYKEAHNWANDVVVVRLTARPVPGFQNQDGKAALWEAVFASPGLKTYRTFTSSIAAAPPDIFKGVVAGLAMPWGAQPAMPCRSISPFSLSTLTPRSPPHPPTPPSG